MSTHSTPTPVTHKVSNSPPAPQVRCPGCGLSAAASGSAPPPEHNATSGCWERYGALLARSYSDPVRRGVHQMVVDAYAGQHSGGTTRREIQATALCLMTLCLVVEDGADPAAGPALHKQMIAHRPAFHWLQPPPPEQWLTVQDVLAADTARQHLDLVRRWGQQVWQAWALHHETIRQWNTIALTRQPPVSSRKTVDNDDVELAQP